MAYLMDHRPDTIRITGRYVDSLTNFIAALSRNPVVQSPIRDLIIASHANPEGLLFIGLNILEPKHITFETLETAVRSRSLHVDSALLRPRPQISGGVDLPPSFHIRGCRIGAAPVYLRKLKEALGDEIAVTAPKHFHFAWQQPNPAGSVEYMGYGYSINRPERLGDKAAVVAAFQTGAFTRIDDQPVPARNWGEWVPRNPHAADEQVVPARVLNPVTNQREKVRGFFRFRVRPLHSEEASIALDVDPGSDAGRKKAVQAELEGSFAYYRATHEFPEYIRLGYAMGEFMDGWAWHFRYDASEHTLFFRPSRAEYTVIQPIVDIASNRLFLNYYPSGRQGAVMELLKVADRRFFETV